MGCRPGRYAAASPAGAIMNPFAPERPIEWAFLGSILLAFAGAVTGVSPSSAGECGSAALAGEYTAAPSISCPTRLPTCTVCHAMCRSGRHRSRTGLLLP